LLNDKINKFWGPAVISKSVGIKIKRKNHPATCHHRIG
jgi:hypothetical protein